MSAVAAPAREGREVAGACDACLRRTWLVARVAGHIEIARHARQSLPEVLALEDAELVAAVAPGEAPAINARLAAFDADAARAAADGAGLTAVCRHDPRYPRPLLEERDAPAILHVAGDLGALDAAVAGPSVAIVGTRRASPYGLSVARALGRDLAIAGVPVVSGMALGIDAAAQTGALDAGGLTVAVLAGAAERAYPRAKAHLHRMIVAHGAVVSEMPPGFVARRWCFPARNRIIAGLADLTLVVEAAERSGSLITAEIAMRLGREVAAVPGQVTAPQSAGANALLRDGATVVRGVDDVLDALFGAARGPRVTRTPRLDPPLRRLLAAVAAGRDTVAALAGSSPERAEQALVGLAELEVRGLVRRERGGRYVVVP